MEFYHEASEPYKYIKFTLHKNCTNRISNINNMDNG